MSLVFVMVSSTILSILAADLRVLSGATLEICVSHWCLGRDLVPLNRLPSRVQRAQYAKDSRNRTSSRAKWTTCKTSRTACDPNCRAKDRKQVWGLVRCAIGDVQDLLDLADTHGTFEKVVVHVFLERRHVGVEVSQGNEEVEEATFVDCVELI